MKRVSQRAIQVAERPSFNTTAEENQARLTTEVSWLIRKLEDNRKDKEFRKKKAEGDPASLGGARIVVNPLKSSGCEDKLYDLDSGGKAFEKIEKEILVVGVVKQDWQSRGEKSLEESPAESEKEKSGFGKVKVAKSRASHEKENCSEVDKIREGFEERKRAFFREKHRQKKSFHDHRSYECGQDVKVASRHCFVSKQFVTRKNSHRAESQHQAVKLEYIAHL